MTGPWRLVDGPGGVLRVYSSPETGDGAGPLLFLCHELPLAKSSAADLGRAYPALADRLAQESGWQVVVGALRGAGGSEGDFSASGWLDDVRALLDDAVSEERAVWLAGFDIGGCVALRVAAVTPAVVGVAALGAPADPAANWNVLLERCRSSGVIRRRGFPRDPATWAKEFQRLRPMEAVGALGDRPLLVVHGADDGEVHPDAARLLTDAAGPGTELRVIPGAGHWLRADPRVMATLLGWLERRR